MSIDVWDALPLGFNWNRVCESTMQLETEELRLDYLSELASHLYSCPDKCDQWGMKTLSEFEAELEQT